MLEDFIVKEKSALSMESNFYQIDDSLVPIEIKNAIVFLQTRFNFCYDSELYQPCPFVPMMSLFDKRSIVPSDLSSDDLDSAISILNLTNSHALKGKILDVVGFLKKDTSLKIQAAEEYYQNFQELVDIGYPSEYISPLKRSLYLLSENNKKSKMGSYIEDLISTKYSTNTQLYISLFLSDFLPKYANKQLSKALPIIKQTLEANLDDPISIDIIENLLKNIKQSEKEKWLALLATIAKKVATSTSPHGYNYLERAAKHFAEDSDEFSELKFLSEEEQKKLYKSIDMSPKSIDLGKTKDFEKYREQIIKILQAQLDGTAQFLVLLMHFNPYDIKTLEKDYKKAKVSIRYQVNNICFNDDGTIAYESLTASDLDKQERIISDLYNNRTSIVCPLILWPFIDNLKFDDEFAKFLDEIVSHNEFVPKERQSIVLEKILSGLHKNISDALYYLIPQLEYGFLSYIKIQKHIYPKYHGNTANLNNILVQKNSSKNRFRDAILEILDASLVQQLEYRLCRKFGGNFRNRDYHHGLSSTTQFSIHEAEAFFLILLVYCQGYDPDL